MIPFAITFHQKDKEPWPDLENVIDLMGSNAPAWQIAVLENGTNEGRPTIALRLDLPDGSGSLVTETTARLFCTAARAIMARYPDLFEGD
jgi:hypothetical protein